MDRNETHDRWVRLQEKIRARREAMEELQKLLAGLHDGAQHVIVLNDYQVANLKTLFRAMGYATMVEPNPLQSAHNGDWVGEIFLKLPEVEHKPNATWDEMAQRALDWRK